MNTAPTDYATAQQELNGLLEELQRPDAPIDRLTEQVSRAKFLIDWAREKLRSTEAEVDALLREE